MPAAGGRFLAPCLTWRQYAANHHERGAKKRPPAAGIARAFLFFRETRSTPMRPSVTVRVPGSTSNLGAGFDCVGIAVGRWIRVTARTARVSAGPAGIIERRGSLRALAVPPA